MKQVIKGIVVTAVGVPVLWLLWLLADGSRPYLRASAPVILDIPRGMRTTEIASQLENLGVIRSRWTFLGLLMLRRPNTLKAGEYEFKDPASTIAVLGKLVRGDVSYEVVKVPEGFNRFEIAEIVAAQGFSTAEQFLAATEDASLIADLDPGAKDLEGYLFPDSYHFPRHAQPPQIVQAMVNRFREVAATLGTLPDDTSLRELVIMASLVEEETGLASERAVVAGVFYNRLRRGLLLQADPTVAYAALVDNGYTGRIRRSDLAYDSPYNTYRHAGLPPGPVSNPGQAALRAALRPQATEYMFFVANMDGGHTFSKTLDEHNLAVAEYRQALEAARAQRASLSTRQPASQGTPAQP
jgi:UPF0755 protein